MQIRYLSPPRRSTPDGQSIAARQLLDGKSIICCDLLAKAGSDVTWQALESYYFSHDTAKNVEQLFKACRCGRFLSKDFQTGEAVRGPWKSA